ncbi:MAG TPA: primosomal protein N' [Candidatus Limiplasma sp.]|nr:primosomal protein N' [Candidatus Limiplasma sp.]
MIAQVVVDVIHENVAKPFSYLVPEGMILEPGTRVRVPLGKRQVDGIVVELCETCDVPSARLRPVLCALETYAAILPPILELAKELAAEDHCPLSEALRLMTPSAMRTGRVQTRREAMAQLNANVDVSAAANEQGRSRKRATLLRMLADGQPHLIAELADLVASPQEALHKLEECGYVRLFDREVYRLPYEDMESRPNSAPSLTAEQQAALRIMTPPLEQGEGAFLLHGVTGSGKTEVYLAMVKRMLELGKAAIILVPEIALTPQMVSWFRDRFGPNTAVLHSRLTDGQRYDEWRRIRLGGARVVIGARSAVFAPVERLGLIVIDEEHEQTYLSDRHPRYDARRVAKSRCAREGATLLLSSATPSILSFAMARRGDYTLVEMPHRVNNRPLPEVTVVDMRKELAAGNRSIFSQLLQQRLKACFERGQQAMLFLNRRGYNTFVSCRNCGYVVKCPQCDVSMTLHQVEGSQTGELHCHFCGAVAAPPTKCPECGSKYIRYFGTGTQKVEEELHRLFPNVKTIRMDIDTTQKRDAHYHLLTAFREGRAQALIGTQMIAKGLDFPHVTLVGVVAADLTLNLPDYRAQERTFQLVTQVAGRAGRADEPGEVVVQSYKPEHPCIIAAAAQDYRAFFTQEFDRRRTGLYPPFTVIARLLVESEQASEAEAMSNRLLDTVEAFLAEHPAQKRRVLMLRASEAPVAKIRGKFRYHVLLKVFEHADAKPVLQLLGELASVSDPNCQIYAEYNPATLI